MKDSKEYNLMLEKVIIFVADYILIDKSKLNEQTKIESDVGISELDTILFYEEYFKKFEITNIHDFDGDKYITSNVIDYKIIFKSILSKEYREKYKLRDVTIKHLTEVAIKKLWFDI